MGIRRGSIVTIFSMHTPEMIYSLYALNKLGAVANIIYMTLSEADILDNLEKTDSSMFLYLDVAWEKIRPIYHRIRVPVVALPLCASMPPLVGMIAGMKKKMHPVGLSYRDFIRRGQSERTMNCVEEAGDRPAVIVYTSGTTGEPKGVILTNRALNSVAFQYGLTDVGLEPGDTFLDAIPPFFGFGVSLGIHAQLGLRAHEILCISPTGEAIAECFMKKKPAHIVTGPALVEELIHCIKGDMSWLKTMGGGGGEMPPDKEKELNETLRAHNCAAEYVQGYGMTEFGATVCTNMNRCKRERALGIPFAMNNVMIIDPDTREELKYDQVGEMCFSSPSLMAGYLNGDAEDRFFTLRGERWFRSGDLGRVDEDGFVYFEGRIKRIFNTRSASGTIYKIFPARVEAALQEHPSVNRCATIVVEDAERMNVMVAYVSLKKACFCSETELGKYLTIKLPEHFSVKKIVILDQIPITPNGKVDYKMLTKLYDGHCG